MKKLIAVNAEEGILYVDHLGYTLRVLLSAAGSAGTDRRTWKVMYKHVVISIIRISTTKKEEK